MSILSAIMDLTPQIFHLKAAPVNRDRQRVLRRIFKLCISHGAWTSFIEVIASNINVRRILTVNVDTINYSRTTLARGIPRAMVQHRNVESIMCSIEKNS